MNATKKEYEERTEAIRGVVRALVYLGNGNAETSFGAIEGLAIKVGEAGEAIANAIPNVDYSAEVSELSEAIKGAGAAIYQGLHEIAKAIKP